MSKRSFKIKRYVFAVIYILLALFAIIQAAFSARYSEEVSSAFTAFASITIFGEEITEVQIMQRTLTFEEFAGFLRKLVGHFGLFAAMGAFGFLALYKVVRTKKVLIIDLLTTFSVAVITEVIQAFIPTRAGLVSDIVLDSQGAIAAVAVIVAIISLRARIKHRKHKRLTFYVAAPAILFATLFLIFNADSFYTYFCYILYVTICAVSLLISAAADII